MTDGRLPDDVGHAYLARLDVDVAPGAVDADALARLQRAHVEHIPYETIEIVLGRPPGIDPIDSARRVVGGRGGYCYQLNGAFSALLAWLGVDVTRHLAGVQGRAVDRPVGPDGNHMALTARCDDGTEWLVDVGLGDGPPEPLRLVAGRHDQRGYRYALSPSTCGEGIWRFDHDPAGGFHGFDADLRAAAGIGDFESMHAKLSTESDFARIVTAQRWVGDEVEILRGCVLTQVAASARSSTDVTDENEWWGVVVDRFGLAYGDVPHDVRNRLWSHVQATHRAWEAKGRP
jgi:N-hydroxyarylamine O-acetyltransferase